MVKGKYILFISAIILVAIVFVFSKKTEDIPVLEVRAVEKIPSRIDTLITSYDSLISSLLNKSGTVGAAIVITYEGKTVYLKTHGVKKYGQDDPVNEHTVFRLASVSKTITGVLAGILDYQNRLNLDAKVVDILQGFQLKDSVNTVDLSIRHILCHGSGLVPHAYDNLVEAKVAMPVIIDSLRLVNISDVPGKLYGYQNVIFSLYDTLSAIKTGKSYSTLLEECIFDPLGMEDASADFRSFSEGENIAYPHRYKQVISLNDRYYNTPAAAGINASISDMGAFIAALSCPSGNTLDQQALMEVFQPQIQSPLASYYLKRWNTVESKHYGLGWRIIGSHGKHIAYHGGFVSGYRAEVAVCPGEKFGIAYLSNSPDSIAAMAVPLFLELYFENP